ncbi:MAG TPA: sugar phosphate nucleotidyltransferase [Armatimonadota bacterium]|nr:sugar phosphate nucleotidyltransferase [Armatimonadota bacterium]HPP73514.1 sugar phosphate nucleotidyltransferase [Armatimonadota bacterium]
MVKSKVIRKAVIPAAGKGTRLQPLTLAIPKEMLPLGKKPVLEIIVDELLSIGIQEILFVISKDKLSIPSYFENARGLKVNWTIQEHQRGLADAILCSEDFVGDDPFLVALGDSIITPNTIPHPTQKVLDCFAQTNAEAVIIVQSTPKEEVSRYGIVHPKSVGGKWFEIDLLVEKPEPENAPSEYAIAGRYAFDPCVFEYIRNTLPGARDEYQITDSIGLMIEDKKPVWCVPLTGKEIRRDIGTFSSYFEAFTQACLDDPEYGKDYRLLIDMLTRRLG